MQYSILIYGTEGVCDRVPDGEQENLMAGHHRLQADLAAKGDFAVARLMPTSNAVSVRPAAGGDGKTLVVDGPFAETKEQFLGFYVVECDTLDEAIAYAEHISSPDVTLEIRPVSWGGGLLGSE